MKIRSISLHLAAKRAQKIAANVWIKSKFRFGQGLLLTPPHFTKPLILS